MIQHQRLKQHFEECDHHGQQLTELTESVLQQQHLQKHSKKMKNEILIFLKKI